jgi:hypothetical protein
VCLTRERRAEVCELFERQRRQRVAVETSLQVAEVCSQVRIGMEYRDAWMVCLPRRPDTAGATGKRRIAVSNSGFRWTAAEGQKTRREGGGGEEICLWTQPQAASRAKGDSTYWQRASVKKIAEPAGQSYPAIRGECGAERSRISSSLLRRKAGCMVKLALCDPTLRANSIAWSHLLSAIGSCYSE